MARLTLATRLWFILIAVAALLATAWPIGTLTLDVTGGVGTGLRLRSLLVPGDEMARTAPRRVEVSAMPCVEKATQETAETCRRRVVLSRAMARSGRGSP